MWDDSRVAKRGGKVHVAVTRRHYKGTEYTTTLLRRSYREDGKVRNETVGNLSHLEDWMIDGLPAVDRAGVEAVGHPAGGAVDARAGVGAGGGQGGGAARCDGLAAGAPGADREDAGPPPPHAGRVRALRLVLELSGRPSLRAWGVGVLAGRQAREVADHLRAVLLAGGPAGIDRGASGEHC